VLKPGLLQNDHPKFGVVSVSVTSVSTSQSAEVQVPCIVAEGGSSATRDETDEANEPDESRLHHRQMQVASHA